MRSNNHQRTVLLLSAACTLLSCRSYMPYAGQPLESTSTAQKVIYETLDQQPGALQREVTNDKFSIVLDHVVLGIVEQKTIYYRQIGDVLLSEKRGVFAVTIRSPTHVALIHVYTYDQASAERFIDALETMRRYAAEARASGAQ